MYRMLTVDNLKYKYVVKFILKNNVIHKIRLTIKSKPFFH
ncbi:protein of unknown function [Tepidibacter aestuarii]|nr:protein of unknown function [Tepidibacter aestuarii]